MKHLTIIVPDGENNLSSIVGAYKIFSRANAYWKETKKKTTHNRFFRSTDERDASLTLTFEMFSINPNLLAGQVAKFI